MAPRVFNEQYKKRLIEEGKNEHGIYNILLADYRRRHKIATSVIKETGAQVVSPRIIHQAAVMVMRQMGVIE